MDYRENRIVEENLSSTILTPHSPTLGDITTLKPEKWKQADIDTRLDALNQLSEQYTDKESREPVKVELGIQHTNANAKEFHEAIGFRPTEDKILIRESLVQENEPYKATATVLEALHLHYKMSAISKNIEHTDKVELQQWEKELDQRKQILEKGTSKEQVKRDIYNLPTTQESKRFAGEANEALQRVHTLTFESKDNATNFTQPLPQGQEEKKNKALTPNQPAQKSQPTQTKKPEEDLEQKKEKKRGRSLGR